ncbi:MAG: hypothetical protein KGI75_31135 [Rhizobiaceae bacterium]|nr:hypothetical protein [Rhizobiaceae bacterium]
MIAFLLVAPLIFLAGCDLSSNSTGNSRRQLKFFAIGLAILVAVVPVFGWLSTLISARALMLATIVLGFFPVSILLVRAFGPPNNAFLSRYGWQCLGAITIFAACPQIAMSGASTQIPFDAMSIIPLNLHVVAGALWGIISAEIGCLAMRTWLREPRTERSPVSALLLAFVLAYVVGQLVFSSGLLSTMAAGIFIGRRQTTVLEARARVRLKALFPSVLQSVSGAAVIFVCRQIVCLAILENCHLGPAFISGLAGFVVPIVGLLSTETIGRWKYVGHRYRERLGALRAVRIEDPGGAAWNLTGTPVGLAAAGLLLVLSISAPTNLPLIDRILWLSAGSILASTAVAVWLAYRTTRVNDQSGGFAASEASARSITIASAIRAIDERRIQKANEKDSDRDYASTAARLIVEYRKRLLSTVSADGDPAASEGCETETSLRRLAEKAQYDTIAGLLASNAIGPELAAKLAFEVEAYSHSPREIKIA